jgi:patatin-like phospholipase/acyl hydrolase
MKYLILSLDGGGIRGVLTAALIAELERRTSFLQGVELIAGTSTGGILALGLAAGKTPSELVDLYAEKGKRIFSRRDLWDRMAVRGDELYRADFGTEPIKEVLKQTLGGVRLSQLSKKVLVSSFDLDKRPAPDAKTKRQWKAKFFHNYEGDSSDGDERAIDVALRTAAAPTYFPAVDGFIDGGVVANNPSACALAKAVKEGEALDSIYLLSIGTGFSPNFIEGDDLDWGLIQWGTRILGLVMDGSLGVPDYQCTQLLGRRYHRLQVPLESPIDLADTDKIGELLALLQTDDVKQRLDEATAFLEGIPGAAPVA